MLNTTYLAKFADELALVNPQMAATIEASIESLASMDERASNHNSDQDFWNPEAWYSYLRPYTVKDGVLQIPVKGALLQDFPYQFFGIATGYEYIQKAFDRGMSDPEVKGIALVINSPGGMVAGNFDLVDKMYAQRGKKPIQAFAAEHAYSAAYSIASVADKLTVARTGGVGSIGVVTSHVDYSKALDKAGVKLTFIHAGKYKVEGNPYEPLSSEAKARIQSRIDALYDVFVATVARNRGIDEKAVRDTEALTFSASESLSNKLADAIGPLEDGLAAFAATLNPKLGGTKMSKEEKAVDQVTIDAARAEGLAAGKAEGLTAGKAEGAQAERARIAGIMALDESKARREVALTMALETDLSVDQAKAVLAKTPEDKPAAGKTPFEAAMESGNPELGAGNGENAEATDKAKILGAYRAAGGSRAKASK